MPLRPVTTEIAHVPAEALNAARWFLGLVTRLPKAMSIPDATTEQFGKDFVAARNAYDVSSDICHTWMTLARAHCLTHGEGELTSERWHSVLQFEQERLRRIREDF